MLNPKLRINFSCTEERQTLKVAIVHYWLVGIRGGEKVLDQMCRLFPQADIFTHVYDETKCGHVFGKHRIIQSKISRFPLSRKLYQAYLPWMPEALEELDLTGYDLILSSEAGPAKGIIPPPDSLHVCYVHSPMRYIWDKYHDYRNNASLPVKIMMQLVAPKLRIWDVTSAQRADILIANSSYVKSRIQKYWRRSAELIYPPVNIDNFGSVPGEELCDFYLWLGELASYKRPDLAIEAFNENGKSLIVIGGPEKAMRHWKTKSKSNIKFLGKADNATVSHHLSRCKALIFPGEEDFGIVPVEALASGRPVIAYNRGGIMDSCRGGIDGVFFESQTKESLNAAICEFEKTFKTQGRDRAHLEKFSPETFRKSIIEVLQSSSKGEWQEFESD